MCYLWSHFSVLTNVHFPVRSSTSVVLPCVCLRCIQSHMLQEVLHSSDHPSVRFVYSEDSRFIMRNRWRTIAFQVSFFFVGKPGGTPRPEQIAFLVFLFLFKFFTLKLRYKFTPWYLYLCKYSLRSFVNKFATIDNL